MLRKNFVFSDMIVIIYNFISVLFRERRVRENYENKIVILCPVPGGFFF